jgi:hypothetical protein
VGLDSPPDGVVRRYLLEAVARRSSVTIGQFCGGIDCSGGDVLLIVLLAIELDEVFNRTEVRLMSAPAAMFST